MELTKEQENLCREFLRKLIYHSYPYEFGFQSKPVFTFTKDEKQEMEKIIGE